MTDTEKHTAHSHDQGHDHAHGHAHEHDDCGCGHDHPHHAPVETFVRGSPTVGRNDPCPCGSGKKHKKCCLA